MYKHDNNIIMITHLILETDVETLIETDRNYRFPDQQRKMTHLLYMFNVMLVVA